MTKATLDIWSSKDIICMPLMNGFAQPKQRKEDNYDRHPR